MMNNVRSIDAPWVVDSKFEPSRPSVDLVKRDRLLALLDEGASRKLALITAPAGYGKSSLVGQWAEEAEKRGVCFGWLTLESEEADEKQFLAYVVLALSRSGVGLDELVTGAQNGFSDSPGEAVLSKLVQILNAIDRKTVLILEDYHRAECNAVNAVIKRLIRDVLSGFTIFIDSRRQPAIDAYALIAAGDAIEINATQLRLTENETLKALSDVGGADDRLEIYRQTEGWPVAVQLARVQKRSRPSEPILAGPDGGLIASYLTEQVLRSLDKETQDLLLAIAFLERFNSDISNFVMKSSTAWGKVESLSSLAALIVPLDNKEKWYRLHHLFAEYLRELQIRRDPSRAKEILILASEWYEERGDVVRAVRYAADAEDFRRCEEIITAAGGWRIILTDSIGELRNALRRVPSTQYSRSPSLLIANAYLCCKDGKIHEARAFLDTAVSLINRDASERLLIDRAVVESMVNVYEDRDVWAEDYVDLREKLLNSGKLNPLENGTIKCEEVQLLMSRGEFANAETALREAFSYMRQSGSVLGLNYCYLHAAHLALHRADFELASANAERALGMAEENFGSDSGLKNLAIVLSYALRIWRGQASGDDLKALVTALDHIMDYDGWTEIYVTGLEAALLLARQCNQKDYAATLSKRMLLFAKERNLNRLAAFTSVTIERFSDNSSRIETHPNVLDLAAGLSTETDQRYWQVAVEAAVTASAENSEVEAEKKLDSALALTEKLDANLKRLMVSLALTKRRMQAGEEYQSILLNAMKRALRERIWGPFLADLDILRAMREIRPMLRHDEQELITLRFVEDVLEQAKQLSPSKVEGVFSEREHEIIQKLAEGKSNKEIARALELTENTIKFHLKSIFFKLSVNKRTQAVMEAQRRGLID